MQFSQKLMIIKGGVFVLFWVFVFGRTWSCVQSHKAVNEHWRLNEWERRLDSSRQTSLKFLWTLHVASFMHSNCSALSETYNVPTLYACVYTLNVFVSGPLTYECQSLFTDATGRLKDFFFFLRAQFLYDSQSCYHIYIFLSFLSYS